MTNNRELLQERMRILHTLTLCVEKFPQYTIAQHITHFMRSKGTTSDKYFWNDIQMLSLVENYYDELCTDLEQKNTED
jgi:hypothetical protein